MTYVTVTLRQSLELPPGAAFVVSLTVPWLVVFTLGVGSALTIRALDEE